MLNTVIKKNSYQDSVTLMLLTNHIAELKDVVKVSIMMGTPANKDILAASGLGTPELAEAGANDIAIVMELADGGSSERVLDEIDAFLARQGAKETTATTEVARSWDQALVACPDANLVLLSIPGSYVFSEAETALDKGKHVFIFSDNVPLQDELRLKTKAAERGLLVMGPDCGTALIAGVPLAFANVVPRGNIGIVGASGTGIQEISCQIALRGGGISHAIGTGGRDITETIGATTMKMGIAALAADSSTDCIVIVSKPPAPNVREELLTIMRSVDKPIVAHFLGEHFASHEPGLYFAQTLEEAAELALLLTEGEAGLLETTEYQPTVLDTVPLSNESARGIYGLYTGGTLAGEAAVMIEQALGICGEHHSHPEGFMLAQGEHTIIDLGDDVYTQGKPHPMIAPANRAEFIRQIPARSEVGVVLLDFVLGYGAHDDMAKETIPAICEARDTARTAGRDLRFIATICGTMGDPQGYAAQKAALEAVGVLVAGSNASAVATALSLVGLPLRYQQRSVERGAGAGDAGGVDDGAAVGGNALADGDNGSQPGAASASDNVSPLGAGDSTGANTPALLPNSVLTLLSDGPRVINIGLRSFTRPLADRGCPFVHFEWQPLAGGDLHLQRVLNFLTTYREF